MKKNNIIAILYNLISFAIQKYIKNGIEEVK